jgi:HEPN domain-containing protein
LILATGPAPAGVPLELLCFHAQQAAEKAMKAVLVHHGLPIRKTHSIGMLLDLLAAAPIELPDEVRSGIALTDDAVAARYPGVYEPLNSEDHVQAIQLATAIVEWARYCIAPVDETSETRGDIP